MWKKEEQNLLIESMLCQLFLFLSYQRHIVEPIVSFSKKQLYYKKYIMFSNFTPNVKKKLSKYTISQFSFEE